MLVKGLLAALKDTAALKMAPDDADAYLNAYLSNIQQAAAEAELKAGQDFLAANRTKEGVITTASGLQYKVINEGSGPKPTIKDKVKCHYTGRLLDGTVFDSSTQRGEPVVFEVGQVIPGWQELLQLMPVGSKYQVWIPANLAYGAQSAGPIKPNSTLEFEVELLEIVK